MAFALTATILHATLVGTFNHVLTKYNTTSTRGFTIYVILWMTMLFSWAAGLFWLFSFCCCSGRSNRIKGYKNLKPSSKPSALGPETQQILYLFRDQNVRNPVWTGRTELRINQHICIYSRVATRSWTQRYEPSWMQV